MFESVNDRLVDAPATTLPKFKLAGAICRWEIAPEPLKEAVRGTLETELAMLRVPGRTPVAVGVKLICTVQLAFDASDSPLAGQFPPAA